MKQLVPAFFLKMLGFATKVVILLLTLYIVWGVATLYFGWDSPRDWQLKKEGSEIIAKIEIFKSENGRLPTNLKELGLPESERGPLHYALEESGLTYSIWYGTTLGESVIYRSEDGLWH